MLTFFGAGAVYVYNSDELLMSTAFVMGGG